MLVAPASQAAAAQRWRAVGGRGWYETVRGWDGGFDDLGAQAPIMAEEDAHRQAKSHRGRRRHGCVYVWVRVGMGANATAPAAAPVGSSGLRRATIRKGDQLSLGCASHWSDPGRCTAAHLSWSPIRCARSPAPPWCLAVQLPGWHVYSCRAAADCGSYSRVAVWRRVEIYTLTPGSE